MEDCFQLLSLLRVSVYLSCQPSSSSSSRPPSPAKWGLSNWWCWRWSRSFVERRRTWLAAAKCSACWLMWPYYFYVKKGIAESKLLLTYIIILTFLNLQVYVKVSLLCYGYVYLDGREHLSGKVYSVVHAVKDYQSAWQCVWQHLNVVNFGKFYCILCAVKSYWTFWEYPESLLLQLFSLLYIAPPWVLFSRI